MLWRRPWPRRRIGSREPVGPPQRQVQGLAEDEMAVVDSQLTEQRKDLCEKLCRFGSPEAALRPEPGCERRHAELVGR